MVLQKATGLSASEYTLCVWIGTHVHRVPLLNLDISLQHAQAMVEKGLFKRDGNDFYPIGRFDGVAYRKDVLERGGGRVTIVEGPSGPTLQLASKEYLLVSLTDAELDEILSAHKGDKDYEQAYKAVLEFRRQRLRDIENAYANELFDEDAHDFYLRFRQKILSDGKQRSRFLHSMGPRSDLVWNFFNRCLNDKGYYKHIKDLDQYFQLEGCTAKESIALWLELVLVAMHDCCLAYVDEASEQSGFTPRRQFHPWAVQRYAQFNGREPELPKIEEKIPEVNQEEAEMPRGVRIDSYSDEQLTKIAKKVPVELRERFEKMVVGCKGRHIIKGKTDLSPFDYDELIAAGILWKAPNSTIIVCPAYYPLVYAFNEGRHKGKAIFTTLLDEEYVKPAAEQNETPAAPAAEPAPAIEETATSPEPATNDAQAQSSAKAERSDHGHEDLAQSTEAQEPVHHDDAPGVTTELAYDLSQVIGVVDFGTTSSNVPLTVKGLLQMVREGTFKGEIECEIMMRNQALGAELKVPATIIFKE